MLEIWEQRSHSKRGKAVETLPIRCFDEPYTFSVTLEYKRATGETKL